jgi:hypothetical protein
MFHDEHVMPKHVGQSDVKYLPKMSCDWRLTYHAISQKFSLRLGDLKFLEVLLFACHRDLKHARTLMEELWFDFRGKSFSAILNIDQADYRALPNSHSVGTFAVVLSCPILN